MAGRLLLAIDMDGTLLRDDKSIAPQDAEAIRGAAAQGVEVTIATGRLTTGTLPTARSLGLTTPLVCADGGLLIDPVTGVPLQRHPIPPVHAATAVKILSAHGLVPYVFLADSIHCQRGGERHQDLLETWSRDLVVHASLARAEAWQQPESVSLTVGIGTRTAVEKAAEELRARHAKHLDTIHFGMGNRPLWAVRCLPRGCDKGAMLARLAAHIAIPPSRVAVIGDWLNDLGMFKYAGRSFAMGQAPEIVRMAATDILRSTSTTGGGVAEAIAALRDAGR